MWNAAEGLKTFTGPYGLMLAHGLTGMIEQLEYCYEEDEDDHVFGYRAFANLTLEQKIWTVHKVAFGLLDRKTPVVPLTAYLEATVATIFRQLESLVEEEIDCAREFTELEPQEMRDWCYPVRQAIFTAHEHAGRNLPPFVEEDEEPLTFVCENIDQWTDAIECMEDSVLWDADYEDEYFADMPPKHDEQLKLMFGVSNEYYCSIPDDPQPEEAKRLLQEASQLCERVIRREEQNLNRT